MTTCRRCPHCKLLIGAPLVSEPVIVLPLDQWRELVAEVRDIQKKVMLSRGQHNRIDALRAEVAALNEELERWKAPLTDEQVSSICAIIDVDESPSVASKTRAADTVIRAVREAGEKT